MQTMGLIRTKESAINYKLRLSFKLKRPNNKSNIINKRGKIIITIKHNTFQTELNTTQKKKN